jgi:hypothetical protein
MRRSSRKPRLSYFVIAMLISMAALTLPAMAHEYTGQVMSAEAGRLVVRMGTEELTFMVGPNTQVFLDGAPSELGKLRRGYSATVSAERLGDLFMAQRIRARSAVIGQR